MASELVARIGVVYVLRMIIIYKIVYCLHIQAERTKE